MPTPIDILGIPGSLRRDSWNRRLLLAACERAPADVRLTVYEDLGAVPLFNEDLEGPDHGCPEGVARLRRAVEQADAVLISTPEYNQSMPGVLKNAIDWLSRPPRSSFAGKPVALMGATTGEWGTRLSQAALRQTLFACGADLLQVPHLYLRKAGSLFSAGDVLGEETSAAIAALLEAIRDSATSRSRGEAEG